jgi:hypothetical protein
MLHVLALIGEVGSSHPSPLVAVLMMAASDDVETQILAEQEGDDLVDGEDHAGFRYDRFGLELCAICREPMASCEQLESLPCCHKFHRDCLLTYGETGKKHYLDLPCATCKVTPSEVLSEGGDHRLLQDAQSRGEFAPQIEATQLNGLGIEAPPAEVDVDEAEPDVPESVSEAESDISAAVMKRPAAKACFGSKSKVAKKNASNAPSETDASAPDAPSEPSAAASKDAKWLPPRVSRAFAGLAKARPKASVAHVAKPPPKRKRREASKTDDDDDEPLAKLAKPSSLKNFFAKASGKALAVSKARLPKPMPKQEPLQEPLQAIDDNQPKRCFFCHVTEDDNGTELMVDSKKRNTFRCKKCTTSRTIFYESGDWAQIMQMTPDEKQYFFETAKSMTKEQKLILGQKTKKENYTNKVDSTGARGSFFPLGWYERQGFDTARIIAKTKPEDYTEDEVLGPCYRVAISFKDSQTDRGQNQSTELQANTDSGSSSSGLTLGSVVSSESIQEMLNKKKAEVKQLIKRESSKTGELKKLTLINAGIKLSKLPPAWRSANPMAGIINDFEDLDVHDDKFDEKLASLKEQHAPMVKCIKTFT